MRGAEGALSGWLFGNSRGTEAEFSTATGGFFKVVSVPLWKFEAVFDTLGVIEGALTVLSSTGLNVL
jgi:hypothetical protein